MTPRQVLNELKKHPEIVTMLSAEAGDILLAESEDADSTYEEVGKEALRIVSEWEWPDPDPETNVIPFVGASEDTPQELLQKASVDEGITEVVCIIQKGEDTDIIWSATSNVNLVYAQNCLRRCVDKQLDLSNPANRIT